MKTTNLASAMFLLFSTLLTAKNEGDTSIEAQTLNALMRDCGFAPIETVEKTEDGVIVTLEDSVEFEMNIPMQA